MEDIDYYEIPIYNFPYDVEEDDEETIADNMELRVSHLLLGFSLLIMRIHRLYCPSLSLGRKKKLNSMESLLGPEFTRGA